MSSGHSAESVDATFAVFGLVIFQPEGHLGFVEVTFFILVPFLQLMVIFWDVDVVAPASVPISNEASIFLAAAVPLCWLLKAADAFLPHMLLIGEGPPGCWAIQEVKL